MANGRFGMDDLLYVLGVLQQPQELHHPIKEQGLLAEKIRFGVYLEEGYQTVGEVARFYGDILRLHLLVVFVVVLVYGHLEPVAVRVGV